MVSFFTSIMTRIYTSPPVNEIRRDEESNSSNDINIEDVSRAIEAERESHIVQSQERMETFENIL